MKMHFYKLRMFFAVSMFVMTYIILVDMIYVIKSEWFRVFLRYLGEKSGLKFFKDKDQIEAIQRAKLMMLSNQPVRQPFCPTEQCRFYKDVCSKSLVLQPAASDPSLDPLTNLEHYKALERKCVKDTGIRIGKKDLRLVGTQNWVHECNASILETVAIPEVKSIENAAGRYLKNFKNPCWLEKVTTPDPYGGKTYSFVDPHLQFVVDPNDQYAGKMKMRMAKGNGYRMRCLPYFFVLGPEHSGGVDLFEKMQFHTFQSPPRLKQPHYWTKGIVDRVPLDQYVDIFDKAADEIASAYINCASNLHILHPVFTGESSPNIIYDPWFKNYQKSKSRATDVTSYISRLLPDARFIVMLRNPVYRLYSDFLFFNHAFDKTPEMFDRLVTKAVDGLVACLRQKSSARDCVTPSKKPRVWDPTTAIAKGIYAEMLRDWYLVFPKTQFLLLTFDYYLDDKFNTLGRVFSFLETAVYPQSELRYVETAPTRDIFPPGEHGNMLPKTRDMLTSFYKAFNQQLAQLTGDDLFLAWNRPHFVEDWKEGRKPPLKPDVFKYEI